jgi:hypothetical protein
MILNSLTKSNGTLTTLLAIFSIVDMRSCSKYARSARLADSPQWTTLLNVSKSPDIRSMDPSKVLLPRTSESRVSWLSVSVPVDSSFELKEDQNISKAESKQIHLSSLARLVAGGTDSLATGCNNFIRCRTTGMSSRTLANMDLQCKFCC